MNTNQIVKSAYRNLGGYFPSDPLPTGTVWADTDETINARYADWLQNNNEIISAFVKAIEADERGRL